MPDNRKMRQFVAILNSSLLTLCLIVCFGVQAAAEDAHKCCPRGKDKPHHSQDVSSASCAMKAMEPAKAFQWAPELTAQKLSAHSGLQPAGSFQITVISQAPPGDLPILNRVLRL